MKPMGLNSTQFLSYRDIKIENTDLIEDAFGLNSQYCDVIYLIRQLDVAPGKGLTDKLIRRIRKHH